MAFLPQAPQDVASKPLEQLASEAGGGGLPLLPPGNYRAVFVKSEMKPTKDNTGQFLELKLVITDGEYRDTEFTERLNLVNQNQTAVKIAYATLAKIAQSVGLNGLPNDSAALHNKPFIVKLKTEKGEQYKDREGQIREGKDKSVIAGYDALPAGSVTSTGPGTASASVHPTQAPMPWGNR